MSQDIVDYLGVMSLGALVGIGELVARYREAPTRTLRMAPAIVYIALNASASCAGLVLVRAYGWQFTANPPASGSSDASRLTQALVAGFGAMALFRSSLFTVRVGDKDVGIGPVAFLQVVLTAADRAVDMRNAKVRNAIVTTTMRGVSFERAREVLPPFCFALMQNLSDEDQQTFGRQVNEINNGSMDDETKAILLGLALLNLVGQYVLTDAVESLGPKIRPPLP